MYYDPVLCGKRIRELRIMKGMTQEQLAEDLNLSHVHMSKLETGKHRASIDILIEIAVYFDVTLDFLVMGKVNTNAMTKHFLKQVIGELLEYEKML